MDENVYTIGKGKLLIKLSGESNFHDFGNAPDFKITEGITKKPHYSSRSGTKTKDKDPVTEQVATASFTVDDLKNENLRMWLMSNAITDVVQTSGTASAQEVTAELDKWIELGKLKLSSVVVKAETPDNWSDTDWDTGEFCLPTTPNGYRYEATTGGNSGTTEPAWPTTVGETVTDGTVVWTCRKLTYTLNTDYRLDTEVGHLMPLSDGDIEEAQALKVDYSYAAVTIHRVSAATVSAIEGHLFFVGNPPIGKKLDVKGYVSLSPKGDFSFIGDDYAGIQFEAEFLSGYGYTGLYDLYDRGIVT